MAALQPTRMLDLTAYISVPAVTATYGSALTAGHFWKGPKVTKRPSPHHSAPRLGSVCPNAGLKSWAAATRHPWRGAANPASCRVAHDFKPAFGQRGLTGRFRSKARSRSRAARLASWLPSIASELCRYLWLSQASQLPPLLLCCVSAAMPLDSPGLPAFRQPVPPTDYPPHTWPSPPASHGWPSRYAA